MVLETGGSSVRNVADGAAGASHIRGCSDHTPRQKLRL